MSVFVAIDFETADKGADSACCAAARLAKPAHRFVCTVRLLPDVCSRLKIELNHHEALSDALACARIVIAAQKQGVKL